MKKLIITLALVLVWMGSALAQEKEFRLITWKSGASGNVQEAKVLVAAEGKKQIYLTGEDGKELVFKSPMEAMNYVSKSGWNLETAYTDGEFAAYNMNHYWVISKPVGE